MSDRGGSAARRRRLTCGARCIIFVVMIVASACRGGPAGRSEGDRRSPTVATAADAEPSAGCRPGVAAGLVGARRALVVDGVERSYLIDAAAGPGDVPRPLVLAFHGFRHYAAGLREGIGFATLAADGALVAVHPDGREGVELLGTSGRGWDTGPGETRDLAFVRALLDAVEAERCIDRRRIFATGFSNGGFLANLLGCQLADRLAAVAPVAGARALDDCRPAAPIPVLLFHGGADRVVPLRLSKAARAWWRRVDGCQPADEVRDGCVSANGCAADVVVCEGPQAHTWPRDATDRIWRFFQAHPRRAASIAEPLSDFLGKAPLTLNYDTRMSVPMPFVMAQLVLHGRKSPHTRMLIDSGSALSGWRPD